MHKVLYTQQVFTQIIFYTEKLLYTANFYTRCCHVHRHLTRLAVSKPLEELDLPEMPFAPSKSDDDDKAGKMRGIRSSWGVGGPRG